MCLVLSVLTGFVVPFSELPDIRNESVLMIKSNMIVEEDELMNIESDLFTYITNTGESCQILAVDTDLLTYELKKRFGVDYDDSNDFYDPDQYEDGRNNEIQERIIHNLHEECFKGTSDDEDGIEGVIDYLEPTSYDGFMDLDEEKYNKRRCRLLGMPIQKLRGNYQDWLDSKSCGNLVESVAGIKSLREDGNKDFCQILNLKAMLREFLVLILLFPYYFISLMYNRDIVQIK
ncbi:hypothetical protein Tco_0033893 [Tanacetum coccineum]